MEFTFSHDGRTFHLHTETGQVQCDEIVEQPQPQQPLEPAGDSDE